MIDKVNALDTNAGALVSSVQSSVDLRGNVRIIVDDEKLGRYVHFDQHNIIVNGAKNVMASLLADGSSSSPIQYMDFGVGRDSWDILNPEAPQASATMLAAQEVQPNRKWIARQIDSRTVTGNTTKFVVVLEKEAPIGVDTMAITEAGLFAYASQVSQGGVLFAYETFPALIKNNTRQITFEWSIIF